MQKIDTTRQYSFAKSTESIPIGKFLVNQMAVMGNFKVIAL